MKVLIANPAYRVKLKNNYEKYFFCAGSRCPWSLVKYKDFKPRYSMFPFFMAYAAALLENNEINVEVIDAVPINLSENVFLNKVYNLNPDIILFEPASVSFNMIIKYARYFKLSLNSIIVLTGPHVSVFSVEILNKYKSIDYILLGEYEYTFLELVKSIKEGKKINDIQGLVYKEKNTVCLNPKKKLIDLNILPFPARHLFPYKTSPGLDYYFDGFCQNKPAIQMHSSRGCPHKCIFCVLPAVMYKPGIYRMFSPERVVDEMQEIVEKYGAKEIYFDDDSFTVNKKHVQSICNEINKRKMNIPWSVMGDAISTDEEMLENMRNAGCIGIKFGLESADQDILKTIKKPLKLSKLEDLVKKCSKLKIKTHITVSFGHINETKNTIKKTLDYTYKLNTDSIQFSIATCYPGTEFYNMVKKENRLLVNNWEELDPTHNSIIKSDSYSLQYLKEIEANSHKIWLKRKLFKPEWVYKQIYFFLYLLKKQGVKGFIMRIKRAFNILFSNKFK